MSRPANFGLEPLGAGVGLRREHYREIIERRPAVRWFEVIPENYLNRGGFVTDWLRRIGEHYRLIAHGVSLSIGSSDPLDMEHLRAVKRFCDEIGSPWFSDHLCFTMVDHVNLNDLIPLPFTDEAVRHVVARVKVVQEVLERPLLLENVTYYMAPSRSEMSEAEFISRIAEEADCGLLLDVSNVVLNSRNQDYDAVAFLDSLPLHRVGVLHLAGFEPFDGVWLDSHARPVDPQTWTLFREVIRRIGPTSPLVEWDADIPSLDHLLHEADLAQRIMDETAAERGAPAA
ncbi:MAG TPA: DUF692 domain-containing protein [Phycisphaerae bacterium]|nr:DUF692 domain-containing protein [Phycisphaerae bacterium]